jgi:hypothetical protein
MDLIFSPGLRTIAYHLLVEVDLPSRAIAERFGTRNLHVGFMSLLLNLDVHLSDVFPLPVRAANTTAFDDYTYFIAGCIQVICCRRLLLHSQRLGLQSSSFIQLNLTAKGRPRPLPWRYGANSVYERLLLTMICENRISILKGASSVSCEKSCQIKVGNQLLMNN